MPGPTIRATEGDRLRVRFVNQGTHPHTIHFHGWHPPAMDGSLPEHQVMPGESFVYEFDAEPAGLHLYHCHAVPLKRHIHKGLYGTFIVDPRGGRPPADELVMMMNGFDTNFDNENEVYAVNTVANAYMTDPIKVTVGRLVRIYLVNITEFDLINSFHLHGMFFDAYGRARAASRATTPTPSRSARASARFSRRPSAIRASSCSTRIRASSPSSGGWGCSGPRRRAVNPDAPAPLLPAPLASQPTISSVAAGALRRSCCWPGCSRSSSGWARAGSCRTAASRRSSGSPSRSRRWRPTGSTLSVLNDGPDAVTIAQVTVDDAFWTFEASRQERWPTSSGRNCAFRIPWVHGETHVVKLHDVDGR